MNTALAKVTRKTQISRPLKVLVPLIKDEINAGNEAGLEHYRRAGEMLIEAKDQVAHGSWSRWLTTNFELGKRTAQNYMRLARLAASNDPKYAGACAIEDALGEQPRRERHAVWGKVRDDADRVNVTQLADARQSRDPEIELHRKLALQLIELGYRALATRLHPDRGGSRDAMARLNVVRDQLKDIAATRRFV
jgi:hypothetical protein